MYKLYKRIGESFTEGEELIGDFEIFKEALAFGEKNICKSDFYEPLSATFTDEPDCFWFSDNKDQQESYKGRIVKF